jgi:hypothetical protein
MPQFGGKDSKRHFTVVISGKEHGLYVSSTPSSAARKVVTKLCAANKSKKVEFHIREITQGSKKKTYGPYSGHIEKLKEPIKLKSYVIEHKPVAKLIGNSGAKNIVKKEMKGGVHYLKKIIIDNEEIAKKIQKKLKDLFGEEIEVVIGFNNESNNESNNKSNNKSNTKIKLKIYTNYNMLLFPKEKEYERQEDLKKSVDTELKKIFEESPDIFKNKNYWKFISNGENTNNDE